MYAVGENPKSRRARKSRRKTEQIGIAQVPLGVRAPVGWPVPFRPYNTYARARAAFFAWLLLSGASLLPCLLEAGPPGTRTLSGIVLTQKKEALAGVFVTVRSSRGEQRAVTDADGHFRFAVPWELLTLRVEGDNVAPLERRIAPSEPTENLEIEISFVLPRLHERVVVAATTLEPSIDRRNDAVYRNTLFARDDQLLFTLDAGISAGQHEGGGKSVEIRRFGYNLDHGGVNGGLKILVDGVQQNQGTQGHGQGYLGQLKSLTAELIESVDVLNGPFSAEYGDFSGLGVVEIRLRDSLPDQLTLRLQGGLFGSFRTFLAFSPQWKQTDSFLAYEGSRTDGPFQNPLRYRRDNFTGNYTRHFGDRDTISFKLNAGRSRFLSSGQLPLDEVEAGRLDRFGFLDPYDGGRAQSATLAASYRKEKPTGDIFKLDGFLSRSLLDLFSNFTFFLRDSINGDGIQQHDSRLQEGVNAQYQHLYSLFGRRLLLIAGSNFHNSQINVALLPRVERNAVGVTTSAHAHVANTGGYLQQGIDLWRGRLHFDGGLRLDYFRFQVSDRIQPALSGAQGASELQPKANLALTPSLRFPLTLYVNYGRGIASQDARGVVQKPRGPKVSTTDFYQAGASYHLKRFSLASDLFLIDRSNEQVYIPDDGSLEFKGPSRSYGFEVKTSVQLTRRAAFNGGLSRVSNAFYRGTSPRIYVDSAPHTVANAALTLAGWHGFTGSLRYRHVSGYRLDGLDARIRATGLDVVDLSLSRQLRRGVELSVAVDNLTNKRYFETQNYFASRLRPTDPVVDRIHGSPSYPLGVTLGLTFRLFDKTQ